MSGSITVPERCRPTSSHTITGLRQMRQDGTTEEHIIPIGNANPGRCAPIASGAGHDCGHAHGPDCGQHAVPHGEHMEYLVNGGGIALMAIIATTIERSTSFADDG